MTVPCYFEDHNQCHIKESPQNFFGTCSAVIDRGKLYEDIFVNANGNLERVEETPFCEDKVCKICHIDEL